MTNTKKPETAEEIREWMEGLNARQLELYSRGVNTYEAVREVVGAESFTVLREEDNASRQCLVLLAPSIIAAAQSGDINRLFQHIRPFIVSAWISATLWERHYGLAPARAAWECTEVVVSPTAAGGRLRGETL